LVTRRFINHIIEQINNVPEISIYVQKNLSAN